VHPDVEIGGGTGHASVYRMRTMSRTVRSLPLSLGFLAVALTPAGCLDRGGLDPLPDAGGANDSGWASDSRASGGSNGTGTGGAATGGKGAGSGSGGASTSGGAPGSGGAKMGTGGSTSSGGRPGTGTGGRAGSGGATATGGAKGTGGAPGTGGKTMCGPVCDIFCPHGNVPDANGCPTCKCNPMPNCPQIKCAMDCPHGYAKDEKGCQTCTCNPDPMACTPAECGTMPPVDNIVCPAGASAPAADPVPGDVAIVAPFTCARDASGKCVWLSTGCRVCPTIACQPCPNGYEIGPDGCSSCVCKPTTTSVCGSYNSAGACAADMSCTWLQPGCTEPALAAAGCFARASVGCTTDASCGAGHQCLKRTVNPCAGMGTGNGGTACAACAMTVMICQ
jgi:hypothetical protein